MKLIKRELLPAILKWLDKPEIIVVIGSRQVGKTTLLKMIFEQIQSARKRHYFQPKFKYCNTDRRLHCFFLPFWAV